MQAFTRVLEKTLEVTAVGSNQTTALFPVKKGTRVLWVTVMPLVAAAGSTSSTISIGDGNTAGGFVRATTDLDPETMVPGTPIAGGGTYLANSGGFLYTADDTVDLFYTANSATGAKPKVRVQMGVIALPN